MNKTPHENGAYAARNVRIWKHTIIQPIQHLQPRKSVCIDFVYRIILLIIILQRTIRTLHGQDRWRTAKFQDHKIAQWGSTYQKGRICSQWKASFTLYIFKAVYELKNKTYAWNEAITDILESAELRDALCYAFKLWESQNWLAEAPKRCLSSWGCANGYLVSASMDKVVTRNRCQVMLRME